MSKKRIYFSTLLLVFLSSEVSAKKLEPHGNPDAPDKGTFKYNLSSSPTTLNPLSSTDAYATRVQDYVVESLLAKDMETYDWVPNLAKDWEISEDGLKYTFTIRDGVKWHDGKPLTIDDVIFSFRAIKHPENKYHTAHMLPYFEKIKKVEKVGKNKVRFTASEKYFGNFDVVAGMLDIVPKHLYKDPTEEEKTKLNKTLVGTGPYKLEEFERGRHLILKKNTDWWGEGVDYYKSMYNFDRIYMRFVKEDIKAIQRLTRGDLDFISLSPERFVKNTTGEDWGKTIFKKKVQNKKPKSYAFVGWNLKKPIFKSRKTRRALAHLFNRELMIEKFMYGLTKKATGPFYRQSMYANEDVEPIEFDLGKALKLLREDGWEDVDKDQILEKTINGREHEMKFTILEPLQDFMKYLTIVKEDARQVGVQINLKQVEWSTFIKLLDEKNFDGVRLAWSGGSVDWDPKQIWHSDSITGGGSNFVSYSNPDVDRLIEKARKTMERKERAKILKQVYKEIANDAPYVFFFNSPYSLYAHTKRMQMVKDTMTYDIGHEYWWLSK